MLNVLDFTPLERLLFEQSRFLHSPGLGWYDGLIEKHQTTSLKSTPMPASPLIHPPPVWRKAIPPGPAPESDLLTNPGFETNDYSA